MIEQTFLKGKVALVTGASSGSGVDIAQELARCGARVAVHYRHSRDGAAAVVAKIRAAGGEAQTFQADVALAEDVRRLVGEVESALAPVSVLVNNAGPFADTAFRTLTERDWDYVMSANLKSVFLACQRVLPGMEKLGWGRIVNLGATSALVRSHSVYGLAKAALLHMTESMAVEFAPHVTVNAVVPSQIASARTDTMPAYKAAAIAATPLERLVTQPEIAKMVALLCSPAFDFVTGRTIIMDGGRSIPVFPKLNLAVDTEP
jgi:NAD(P)-dependent dehydrogenase (short-subunit alcohol dehydrogenase family)